MNVVRLTWTLPLCSRASLGSSQDKVEACGTAGPAAGGYESDDGMVEMLGSPPVLRGLLPLLGTMPVLSLVDPSNMEWGGPTKGGRLPEPTRFGDWEKKARCIDF